MQEAIQPFTPNVQAEFHQWIRRPERAYARMSPEKQCILLMFLRMPDIRPSNEWKQTFERSCMIIGWMNILHFRDYVTVGPSTR